MTHLTTLDYDEDKEEYDKLVEEKAILGLRISINQTGKTLDEVNGERIQKQDATRRLDQIIPMNF